MIVSMSEEAEKPAPQSAPAAEESTPPTASSPEAPPAEDTSMVQSLALLHQIEWTAVAIGVLLAIGSWFVQAPNTARYAVFVGAAFASINFRLMIWSWSWVFRDPNPQQSAEQRTGGKAVPRFLLKYIFLLAGIGLLVGGLKLHVVGFMIGLGNVVIAVALAPLMMQAMPRSS